MKRFDRIKLCLGSWSLHSEFFNGEIRPEEFPRIARHEFGVRQIEFYEGDFAADFLHTDKLRSIADAVAAACRNEGVSLVAISAVNDLTLAHETESFETDLRRIRMWFDLAPILGYRYLRINSGRQPLTDESVARFVTVLRELVPQAADCGVHLVLENHPHLLSPSSIDRFLQVVSMVNHTALGVCLDVGAFTPGFWKEGCRKLAPCAQHVHLKPDVSDTHNAPVEISQYFPVVLETLMQRATPFTGSVTLEYTEFQRRGENHRAKIFDYLGSAARCLQTYLEPCESRTTEVEEDSVARKVFRDEYSSPDDSLLRLLADGCQTQLDSSVTIHDFARIQNIHSGGSSHRPVANDRNPRSRTTEVAASTASSPSTDTGPSPPKSQFCYLVEQTHQGRKRCQGFHEEQLKLVELGGVTSRVSPCPMGLMTLTVPITDRRHIFGAISCGPWIELGTEGMVTAAIASMPTETMSKLHLASLELIPFETGRLQSSKQTIEQLADHLSRLYSERFATLRNLRDGSELIDELRELVNRISDEHDLEHADVRGIADRFRDVLQSFLDLLPMGDLALYALEDPHDGSGKFLTCVLSTGKPDERLPDSIPISGTTPTAWRQEIKDEYERRQLKTITPKLHDSRLFAFYVSSMDIQLTEHDEILVRQMVAEIEHSADHLLNLSAARAQEAGLRFFIARLKHAIAGSLQAIDTDVRQLRKWIGDPAPDSQSESQIHVRAIHDRLRSSSNMAGGILKHLVGQVRHVGPDRLRPALRKERLNLVEILKASFRNFQQAADNRSVTMRLSTPVNEEAILVADLAAIRELVDNLTQNAVKYARSGSYLKGVVALSRTLDRSMPNQPWTLLSSGVRLVIENVGPPIPTDQLHKIFDAFYQGDNDPPGDTANSGTGIGLAICRQTVDQHLGKIFVRQRIIPANPNGDSNITFIADLPSGV